MYCDEAGLVHCQGQGSLVEKGPFNGIKSFVAYRKNVNILIVDCVVVSSDPHTFSYVSLP